MSSLQTSLFMKTLSHWRPNQNFEGKQLWPSGVHCVWVVKGLPGQHPGMWKTFVWRESLPVPVILLTFFRATNSFSALARRPTSSSYLSDKDEEGAFYPWTQSWLLPAAQLSPFMTSLAPARSLAPCFHPHVLHSAPSLRPFRLWFLQIPFTFSNWVWGLKIWTLAVVLCWKCFRVTALDLRGSSILLVAGPGHCLQNQGFPFLGSTHPCSQAGLGTGCAQSQVSLFLRTRRGFTLPYISLPCPCLQAGNWNQHSTLILAGAPIWAWLLHWEPALCPSLVHMVQMPLTSSWNPQGHPACGSSQPPTGPDHCSLHPAACVGWWCSSRRGAPGCSWHISALGGSSTLSLGAYSAVPGTAPKSTEARTWQLSAQYDHLCMD